MMWEVIREMDDENGNPTCWATTVNSVDYGRFIWITKHSTNQYVIEFKNDFECYEQLAKHRSLKKLRNMLKNYSSNKNPLDKMHKLGGFILLILIVDNRIE